MECKNKVRILLSKYLVKNPFETPTPYKVNLDLWNLLKEFKPFLTFSIAASAGAGDRWLILFYH